MKGILQTHKLVVGLKPGEHLGLIHLNVIENVKPKVSNIKNVLLSNVMRNTCQGIDIRGLLDTRDFLDTCETIVIFVKDTLIDTYKT